ncbi:MAG: class I SAM-dependent methyltransferase [Chloroflexota bacterium]
MRKDYVEVGRHEASQGQEAFVEGYWSAQWERFSNLPDPRGVSSREEYRLMARWLHALPPGSKIVDGGCGLGEWSVKLSQEGFDLVGMDLSRETIARLNAHNPPCTFVAGDIRHTRFEDSTFDAYFSWGTFEHFEDGLQPCIAEAFRILKPGGGLFITVPFQNWRHILRDARPFRRWDEHDLLPGNGTAAPARFYQWRLTAPELHRELALQGFRVLHIQPIGKEQGAYRTLLRDVRQLREGTVAFAVTRRLLTFLLPAKFVSHMLFAAARKDA